MTDEELDDARAKEAVRRNGSRYIWSESAAVIAARLTREGWMPPDPLDAEVATLMGWEPPDSMVNTVWVRAQLRKALERGIEIGRGHD